jgi:hypothetical protein
MSHRTVKPGQTQYTENMIQVKLVILERDNLLPSWEEANVRRDNDMMLLERAASSGLNEPGMGGTLDSGTQAHLLSLYPKSKSKK